MKEIKLTKGKSAIIDDDDFERVSKHGWCYDSAGTGYAQAKVNGKVERLHRFIMNFPKGMSVDHINGNGLDNRKENLRIVTHAENMRNKRKPKPRFSRLKELVKDYRHWKSFYNPE